MLGGKDIQPIPESFAYQAVIPAHLMRSDPLTAELMTNAPIHSWYGPGRQIIAGAKNDGDFYSSTLIVYPTPEDDIPDAVDILVPNSGSSNRKGDLGSMRKSVEMFEPRVRRFIGMVKEQDCFLWKIAYLPKLETWVSSGGRITVLGDAAHAMVPHLGMVRFSFSLCTSEAAIINVNVVGSCFGCGRRWRSLPLPRSLCQHRRYPQSAPCIRKDPKTPNRENPRCGAGYRCL